MTFRDPHWFWLLAVLVPMLVLYVLRERSGRAAVRYSDVSLLDTGTRPAAQWLHHLVFVLRCLGCVLLIVALARPQKGHAHEEIHTEGVDIIIMLDISGSMRALDFKPRNRLYVAKETIKEFVERRRGDRVGLGIFAGRAFTKCPLTLDHHLLVQLLDDVDFGDVEDGTAIGTAIATGAARLLSSSAASRILILLTDGANNRGEIAPLAAAEAAAQAGIRIYTIGVARPGKVPFPVDYIDRRTGKVVETRIQMIESDLDEQTLRDIARVASGRYFHAARAEDLRDIYRTIDELEKSEIHTTSYTTWSEHFHPWLAGGVLCILLQLVAAHTVYRRLP